MKLTCIYCLRISRTCYPDVEYVFIISITSMNKLFSAVVKLLIHTDTKTIQKPTPTSMIRAPYLPVKKFGDVKQCGIQFESS